MVVRKFWFAISESYFKNSAEFLIEISWTAESAQLYGNFRPNILPAELISCLHA
jgi:hypothetical protein